MLLYLMRHGRAEGAAPSRPDHARELTPAGRSEVEQIARAIQYTGWQAQRLLCSPYTRARQTADCVASSIGCSIDVVSTLIPGFGLRELAEAINAVGSPEAVMVVAHQPSIGEVVARLTGSRVQVAPAAIIAIEVARLRRGVGFLKGCYDPGTMARLGRAYEEVDPS